VRGAVGADHADAADHPSDHVGRRSPAAEPPAAGGCEALPGGLSAGPRNHPQHVGILGKEPAKSLPAAQELPVDFDPLEAEPLPEEPAMPPAPILENGAKKSRSQRKRAALDKDMIEDGKPAEPVASLESEA